MTKWLGHVWWIENLTNKEREALRGRDKGREKEDIKAMGQLGDGNIRLNRVQEEKK